MKHRTSALAVTATLASLVLAGCGDDGPKEAADPASESSSASVTLDPTTPTTDEPASSDTGGVADTRPVPVFFVAAAPQGPRLFSELRDVEADDPAAEVLALLMAGDVADPDYRTLVPAGSLETQVESDGTGDDATFSLTLAAEAFVERPADISQADAELAVQQIVYTLLSQAGAGKKSASTGSVEFYLDGDQVSFLGVDGPVTAADELDVRGLVNIASPRDEEQVSGSFEASGEASSFEATVPWEVRDVSGKVVLEGFATAEGWLEGLYPWQTTVDVSGLEPGDYTFAALTDDPSGGEGFGPTEDTRTIVVE